MNLLYDASKLPLTKIASKYTVLKIFEFLENKKWR